jgi:hypothetical protein
LSHHAQTVSKKQALQQFRDELLGVGRIVEGRSFYSQFDSELHQLFSQAYDASDGQISWTQAVQAGWDFAKAIALDTKPVALKAFETQVWGMVRSMVVEQNLTASVEQLTDLRRAVTEFSKSYVRLHPEQESTSGGEGLRLTGFADYTWTGSWERDSNGNVQFSTNAWLGRVYGYWQTLIAGMDVAQLTRSFEVANTLIQGATRVVLLHRDGYQNVRAIHEGGLLRELIELGFELTRTGAVNPAGAVQTSAEWLEAVLEGNVRLVAGGLGQYVQGFEGNYGSPSYAYTNAYRDGLDYLQRLMRAAVAVDEPSLQPQMRDAKFLSHLVNLGGAYAALNPNQTEQAGFFLQSAWRDQGTQQIANELVSFVDGFNTADRSRNLLQYSRNTLLTLKHISSLQSELQKPKYLTEALNLVRPHVLLYETDSTSLAGTYLPFVMQANQLEDFHQAAEIMKIQGGYLVPNIELVAGPGGNRSSYTVQKSLRPYLNRMAAIIYAEATFDPNYHKQMTQARDMRELYAIGQLILNRVQHLKEVPHDFRSFTAYSGTLDSFEREFKNATLDTRVNWVTGDVGQFASYDGNKFTNFNRNWFENLYEQQAANIAILAANRIGMAPGHPGTVPRKYNYIFFWQNENSPSPDRTDPNSRVKFAEHYFWKFKADRIIG